MLYHLHEDYSIFIILFAILSYQNFELIIVDDGSTDNGREILRMHVGLDDRIHVISLAHNTLGGTGIPSNIGIRAATGKY